MINKIQIIMFIIVLIIFAGISNSVFAWPIENGIAISTASGHQQNSQIISDGQGGAIITWEDYRNGSSTTDIYAQAIDSTGRDIWTVNGVAICTASDNQINPQIISDGQGGAIITWLDERDGNNHIYAQAVDSTGTVKWPLGGLAICTVSYFQYAPQLVSDGEGGAIITWENLLPYATSSKIYAQAIDSTGMVKWTSNGVVVSSWASVWPSNPQLISDGHKGAIITWFDIRNGTTNADIYVQGIDSTGLIKWSQGDVPICTAPRDQFHPQLVTDGQGGAIITWFDGRSKESYNMDIYVQAIDSTGSVNWTANGVAICTASGLQQYPQIVSDEQGGAIITWQDQRDGFYHIYAQSIYSVGTVKWNHNGIAICTAFNGQYYPQIVSDGKRGAIIAWNDYRGGGYSDIYAQRINGAGTNQWIENGVGICTATDSQTDCSIVSDGSGGAIITWDDYRNGSGNWDIYTQLIDSNGIAYGPTSVQNWEIFE